MKGFEYNHIVSFEETNLVGNVYFANHIKWQGLCRERFLKEKVPDILEQISDGLALITLNCSCNYLGEVRAFDELKISMFLSSIHQNKVRILFEYYKMKNGEEINLIAKGTHEIGCFKRQGDSLMPVDIPKKFREELEVYS